MIGPVVVEMSLSEGLSPVVTVAAAGVHRLRRKSAAAEKHVEDLFGGHVGLETVRRVVFVKVAATTSSHAVGTPVIGGLGAVKVVLPLLFGVA